MKNIQKDLLAAFEQSGLTYDELAKRTNLPKSALYRYLNGDTEKIPIDRFQSICNELHIDAGFVLGWKDEYKGIGSLNLLYDRIRELRMSLNMSQDDLARAMGYKDRSMITKIESGKVDISQKKIIDFARILGTTPAYLMGWTDNKSEYINLQLFGGSDVHTKEAMIISFAVDKMPPADREKALKMFSAVYSDYIQKAEDKIG